MNRRKHGRYEGLVKAARASGIPEGTLINRVRRGLTVAEATAVGPFDRRATFASRAAAAGMPIATLRARVQRGATFEEAVSKGPREVSKQALLARELGVTRQAVNKQVIELRAAGKTTDEAIELIRTRARERARRRDEKQAAAARKKVLCRDCGRLIAPFGVGDPPLPRKHVCPHKRQCAPGRTGSRSYEPACRLCFERVATAWDKAYPVGTRVALCPVEGGDAIETRTRSRAWTTGGGEALVLVEGRTGGYALGALTPLESPCG